MPLSLLETRAPEGVSSEVIFTGQNRALQRLISGESLEAVFEALVQTVEIGAGGQAVAAILVLDADGNRLRHGAAPSLPDSYNRAIDGIAIGPDIGTCCAAASRNEVVVTPEIETDPGWSKFKALPLALGLRAAWSMPIRSLEGRVLGTFGTYFRECRGPSPLERELVGVLAKTAAVAIERRTTDTALRESESFLQSVMRASPDCIKVLDLEGRLQWMSQNGQTAMEVCDAQSIRNVEWLGFWQDESTRQKAREALDAARGGNLGRFQGACATMRGTPKWWDVLVTSIQDDDGKTQAFLSVSRDITEAKKMVAALRRSEEGYRKLTEELENAIGHRTAELAHTNSLLRAEILEREKAERARQQLQLLLTSAEEEERRRISRELHDQMGQHLTAMMLGLKSLRGHLAPAADEKLRSLEAITETMGKEAHALALRLRPTALDDLGLADALAHYLEEWSERTGISVQYERAAADAERFPPAVETTIYRLAQEALTNVAKHAEARHVAVVIGRCANHVLAIIEDDGKGFDPESTLPSTAPPRLGLRGMRERVAMCGGTLNFESTPGYGTAVFLRIPLGEPEAVDG